MSFIESIPTYHEAMLKAMEPTQNTLRDIAFKLDAHYEAEEKGSHNCDCEFCPYIDADVSDMLDDIEIAELNKLRDKREVELEEQRKAIMRLEGYAKFIGRPLPKEVCLSK